MSDGAQTTQAGSGKRDFPWLIIGIIGLAITVLGGLSNKELLWQSYLFGYTFWLGIGLGSLSLFLLHCLTGGQWGFVIRRILEASTKTLPVFFLLLLPIIFFGMEHLYIWTNPDVVAHDHILQVKAPYLNKTFFIVRMFIYFAVWLFLAHRFYRQSGRQDQDNSEAIVVNMRGWSAPGIIAFFLTMTFFSVDLLLSLEPHYFSTVYGVHIIVGQGLGALALSTIMAIKLSEKEPALASYLTSARLHDLGNLLLALTLFWTYITFTQFLIVWMGNLAEEAPWYLNRARGGWQLLVIALAIFAFVLPFVILLMRPIKKRKASLIKVAGLIFAMRIIDLTWLMLPAFSPAKLQITGLNVIAFIGFTGIYMGLFKRALKARPILPEKDPRLQYILATEDKHHG